MSENTLLQEQQDGTTDLLLQPVKDPLALISDCCTKLAKFGGFDFIESTIEGTQNLNPERKAKKKIFLTEDDRAEERGELLSSLEAWYNLLKDSADVSEILKQCEERSSAAETLLTENLGKAVEAARPLEQSYRSLHVFFSNTQASKINNLSLINASFDQVKDLDTPLLQNAVSDELKGAFDRLDLRENYAFLVMPGYMGKNSVVDKWSRIAHENKAMLLTDFRDCDEPDEVVEEFEKGGFASADAHKANAIMTCNWLVGRGKYKALGEEDDLVLPPSAALAGKMYGTLMSQPSAGNKHGVLSDVDSVKFKLIKSDLSALEKAGLVPMINEYGKVIAFSAKTLFNGDNVGLQTYSVVRTFDYVSKVLMDFLNRRAFENFNVKLKVDLTNQILKYLDTITGPNNLIEKFKFIRLDQDPNQKDRIFVDINITPFFPAKSFLIKLDGTKGDDSDIKWDSKYSA
jgi:hypothetical protein